MAKIDLVQFRELIYQFELVKGNQKLASGWWAQYGDLVTTILTAISSLSVAYLIFVLTRNKDTNDFRGKLYGNLISTQHELLRCFGQRFTSNNLFQTAFAQNRINPTQLNLDRLLELDKELTNSEKEFFAAIKEFYTNVGIYIFYKKGKTQMVSFKTQLDNIGLAARQERFPETLSTHDEISAFAGNQIEEFNPFFAREVEQVTNQMVDVVLHNR